ncbi:MAG: AAA family ATPase, partial [Caedimonadaceae bacterium]
MLAFLSIRNIVLIDKLDVTFERGMTVLTGETGAGKSILLDALNLALGERAQVSLIRPGESHATVIAEFDVGADEGIKNTLEEAGLDFEDRLVLRRSLSRDGKSRAFINDQPVSLALLGDLSSRLREIHGQFDKL